MERSDICWIIVRALGLYFFTQLVHELYRIFAEVLTLNKMYSIAEMGRDVEAQIIRGWVDIGMASVFATLFAILVFYLLRKGHYVHALLMYRTNKHGKET